ncbi:metalloregulator ArsR/SmtB family transcription factor [Acinetobacter bereziniae]|jgi:hypothetical protein|uniref:ArsR/SmtB family transcription factor n=1 Tax=Acinetobacter bereziniae TaxID=106648 RepID=UPI00057321CE|nr:metalloregulator ArsR/SmtB family transcription factor [Acinetobacter bereziniae]MBJ8442793.1 winged helix-turn-helix transcriptional regulator [Acinetobacter bereziniae]MCU4314982.1 metalloregulator ArsR/SmtB family transcription factor [Acinetobacter bereziniae]MDA3442344.1 metalloregulator ArsR/SmtB family transcription factor [Acinetobacter bereziniae]MDQ9819648.1 metalloregulator ArsR/SmtB family transcription factor [Acinetobacter bereziniae]MDV8157651.1 metalloregulator ArsR/SmtB fam
MNLKSDQIELTQEEVHKLADTFKLLGDASRLKILLFCMRGPSSVGEISAALDLSQSLVSHNLRLLRSARLVKGNRQAKQVIYQIADTHVSHVISDMAIHIVEEACEDF